MAIYSVGRNQLNNMERSSGGATKVLDMGTVDSGLSDTDVAVLGALPRESVTTDIRILVHEGFSAGGFTLGYYEYNTDTFTAFAVITPSALTDSGKAIVVDMPVDGQIDMAGALYAGDRGAIWNGVKETVIAVQWNGVTPTTGSCSIVTTHTYYGTKGGEYGLDYVPMKPYKR